MPKGMNEQVAPEATVEYHECIFTYDITDVSGQKWSSMFALDEYGQKASNPSRNEAKSVVIMASNEFSKV